MSTTDITARLARLKVMADRWSLNWRDRDDILAVAQALETAQAEVNRLALQNEAQRVALSYARVDGARNLLNRMEFYEWRTLGADAVMETLRAELQEMEQGP